MACGAASTARRSLKYCPVVSAASGLQRNAENDQNRWIGVRVEEVVEALGPGQVEAVGASGVTLCCGEHRFHVVDGRVLGMR